MPREGNSEMKRAFVWLWLLALVGCAFGEEAGAAVEAAVEAAEGAVAGAEGAAGGGIDWLEFLVPRIFFLAVTGLVLLGIWLAKRGRRFTIRQIPGLAQLEEAVGRATEMGRPALFCTGVSDTSHPELYAAMPILRKIGSSCARYRNRLIIPVCMERTLTLEQATYEEACRSVGELRGFNRSDVRFFPGGQVYFAAATMGYMLKERPAACFYFGYYELESLLLSETGQVVGAMQIAGTSQLFQIPFFIAACDYVIIGEEFFAVSASISGEPKLSGSLFGQDCVKVAIIWLIVLGTIAASLPAVHFLAMEILGKLQN